MSALQNQIAIVTGASSGIGRAIAIELARCGANVAAVGRSLERLQPVLAELRAAGPGAHTAITGDVRNPDDMEAMAKQVHSTFGRIDILINSAGSNGSLAAKREMPFALVQLPEEEWDEIIDTNLKGAFFSNRAVLPYMMEQRSGNIVNVGSSRGAKIPLPLSAAYAASKRGLMGLTGALTHEVREYGIRVHVALPDVTDTPMLRTHANVAPQGLLTTEDVARFVVYVVSQPPDTCLLDPLLLPFKPNFQSLEKTA